MEKSYNSIRLNPSEASSKVGGDYNPTVVSDNIFNKQQAPGPSQLGSWKKQTRQRWKYKESTLLSKENLFIDYPKFVTLKAAQGQKDLRSCCTWKVDSDFTKACGKPKKMWCERDGTLVVEVTSQQQYESVQKLGSKLTAYVHPTLNVTKGVVTTYRFREIGYTIEELKFNLKDQNVTEIYHIVRNIGGVSSPTNTYIISFATAHLPREIFCGYENQKSTHPLPEDSPETTNKINKFISDTKNASNLAKRIKTNDINNTEQTLNNNTLTSNQYASLDDEVNPNLDQINVEVDIHMDASLPTEETQKSIACSSLIQPTSDMNDPSGSRRKSRYRSLIHDFDMPPNMTHSSESRSRSRSRSRYREEENEQRIKTETRTPLIGYDMPFRNYTCFLSPAIGPRLHGGSMVMIRNDIAHSPIILQTQLQAVAVKISLDINYSICSLYLPPGAPFDGKALHNLIKQLPTPYLILGNFNARHFNWGDR
ncbi:unnamed protein product, partial [Rotaria magnacalcarata]